LISLLGIALVLLITWLLSSNRRLINYQTVLSGLFLQGLLAFLLLKLSIGTILFETVGCLIRKTVSFSDYGGAFAFGDLYNIGEGKVIFALKVSSAIIFISACFSVLYYLKIIDPVLRLTSFILQRFLRVSSCEVLAATASALVGQVESVLPLRPYLSKLTKEQFFCIMTGGMATISMALLAVYASCGIPSRYLLAANLMAIPSGILISKILMPDQKKDLKKSRKILPEPEKSKAVNVIEALVIGAQDGLKISVAIVTMIIALVSIVSFLNFLLFKLGLGLEKVSSLENLNLSLEKVMGFIFYPIAFLLGVPIEECFKVGSLIGKKLVLNEFLAFLDLAELIKQDQISSRSLIISSFVLCGFANFGSVAIQAGAFSQMLPEKRGVFSSLGIKSMFAGLFASLLSACWANLFF